MQRQRLDLAALADKIVTDTVGRPFASLGATVGDLLKGMSAGLDELDKAHPEPDDDNNGGPSDDDEDNDQDGDGDGGDDEPPPGSDDLAMGRQIIQVEDELYVDPTPELVALAKALRASVREQRKLSQRLARIEGQNAIILEKGIPGILSSQVELGDVLSRALPARSRVDGGSTELDAVLARNGLAGSALSQKQLAKALQRKIITDAQATLYSSKRVLSADADANAELIKAVAAL